MQSRQRRQSGEEKSAKQTISKPVKQKYDLQFEVGQGSFARVFKVKGKIDNKYYAVKIFDMEKIKKFNALCTIHHEIDILSVLNHENIVKLFQVS